MTVYDWSNPDQSQGSVTAGRFADQVAARLGMSGYSDPARLTGAVAELLAFMGGFVDVLVPQSYLGETGAEKIITALKTRTANATEDLTRPTVVDLRGMASPILLDQDVVTAALTATDRTPVTFLWGPQEVRVAVTQHLRSHHVHVLAGTTFIAKDGDGNRVTATTMFKHGQDFGLGGPGNGAITTDGSAVITKAAPSSANWAYLEVGSPVSILGFVPPLGKDNTTINVGGGINDSTSSVTVTSTTGFPSSGYIRIEDEILFYTSVDATHFLGCSRGSQGTTAASHADTTAVNRCTYKPFYVKSISGNDLTLDGTVDFDSTGVSVVIGPLGVAFEGVGVIDGNFVQGTDDTTNPYGIQIIGGRHCYFSPGIVYQNHDHGAVYLGQCQDCDLNGRAVKCGHPASSLGSGFWVFGWNKRITARVAGDEMFNVLSVDDRSASAELNDGPSEDSSFTVTQARNITNTALLLHGCRRFYGRVECATELGSSGSACNVGGIQWVTTVAATDGAIDIGLVSGTAGFTDFNFGGGVNVHIRSQYPLTPSFTDADTTPSVAGRRVWKCANTNPTSITTFDDGVEAQEIVVILDDNTTLVDGATLQLGSGSNITGTANDAIHLVKVGTVWYQVAIGVN